MLHVAYAFFCIKKSMQTNLVWVKLDNIVWQNSSSSILPKKRTWTQIFKDFDRKNSQYCIFHHQRCLDLIEYLKLRFFCNQKAMQTNLVWDKLDNIV